VFVLVFELAARDVVTDEIDDETAGSHTGVEDLHAWLGYWGAEFALQDLFHAVAHEIHDLLWSVDDAVRVGLLDGEALEEAFVDSVEKFLAFAPAFDATCSPFDGDVIAVKVLEELLAIERAAGEGGDDFFDFGGDDVAVD